MSSNSEMHELITYLDENKYLGYHVVTMQIRNRNSEPQNLYLEPMGDQLVIPPGATYEVGGM
jgi:hypothetical protein